MNAKIPPIVVKSEAKDSRNDHALLPLGFLLSVLIHFILVVLAIFGLPYYVREEVFVAPPLSVSLVASDSHSQATPPPSPMAEPPAAAGDSLVAGAERPLPGLAPEPDKARTEEKSRPVSRKDFLQDMKQNLPEDAKKSKAELSKFVKSLEKKDKKKPQDAQPVTSAPVTRNAPAPAAVAGALAARGRSLNPTEMEAVRRAVEPCWNVDSGAKFDRRMQVAIRLTINREGAVETSTIIDQSRYSSDGAFRAAADAAKRAVENPRCRKLPLPLDN
ncbi:MAG: hypothetical protein ORO03_09815, partial [Alphaproteobacteria bacterium]|nr:hypothetical protein [Alphaproteobacteria bacterium]